VVFVPLVTVAFVRIQDAVTVLGVILVIPIPFRVVNLLAVPPAPVAIATPRVAHFVPAAVGVVVMRAALDLGRLLHRRDQKENGARDVTLHAHQIVPILRVDQLACVPQAAKMVNGMDQSVKLRVARIVWDNSAIKRQAIVPNDVLMVDGTFNRVRIVAHHIVLRIRKGNPSVIRPLGVVEAFVWVNGKVIDVTKTIMYKKRAWTLSQRLSVLSSMEFQQWAVGPLPPSLGRNALLKSWKPNWGSQDSSWIFRCTVLRVFPRVRLSLVHAS
jgi:hypothetical protein